MNVRPAQTITALLSVLALTTLMAAPATASTHVGTVTSGTFFSNITPRSANP